MSSKEGRALYLGARKLVEDAVKSKPRKREAKSRKDDHEKGSRGVDDVHVKCPGCGGSGTSHAKGRTGNPMPCKTCGGHGTISISDLEKRDPESASRHRELHEGKKRHFKPKRPK